MLSKSWLENAASIEPPMVGSVNFQVRTGISAPFEPHMTGRDEKPSATSVNFQVRTGISAPFEPHMTGDDADRDTSAKIAVPAADFMVKED